MNTCPRCQGNGTLPVYNHVQGGICFKCWGTGEDLEGTLRALENELYEARKDWRQTKNRLNSAYTAGITADVTADLRTRLNTITTKGLRLKATHAKLLERVGKLRASARDKTGPKPSF